MHEPWLPTGVEAPSRRRILSAVVLALVTAATLLVLVVLPAEYGIDPLGTGRALGLTALAETPPAALQAASGIYKVDSVEFFLRPFQSIEYKYRLAQDASMVFSWKASASVTYDMHSEPDGAEPGFAQSFDTGAAAEKHGAYTAPFPGIHGWFWENRTASEVRVQLTTSGFYSEAYTISNTGSEPRALKNAREP